VSDFGLRLADDMPKGDGARPGIIRFIEELVDRDYAYAVGGDVYFRVRRDPEYGGCRASAPNQMEKRSEPAEEDPRDFALWKATKPGEDTSWDSRGGRAALAWHIECSAMARDASGRCSRSRRRPRPRDPAHENELAVRRPRRRVAKIWMHNGLLAFGGEKMSKSLGNDVSIRNVLDTWGGVALLSS